VEKIDDRTRIAGDFFDDFLGDCILLYIPLDLKDILDLCLEEPNIIDALAILTSAEPTILSIIKDVIYYYLNNYIYRKLTNLD
jgi:hypothetical protein